MAAMAAMAAAVEIGAEISSYSAHASHFPRSFGSRRRKGMEREGSEEGLQPFLDLSGIGLGQNF